MSFFFNKVADLSPATLLKKGLCHRCFPVRSVKFLRALFYRTPSGNCFWTGLILSRSIKGFGAYELPDPNRALTGL